MKPVKGRVPGIGGTGHSFGFRIYIGSMILLAAVFHVCASARTNGASRRGAVSISGWISDSGCGAAHAKAGGASCIRKCIAGGAGIGHPEWKPQKMVLVDGATKAIWIVTDPSALVGTEGHHVKITGFVNAKKHKLRVDTVDEIVE